VAVHTHYMPAVNELPPASSPGERLYRGGGWLTLVLALAMLFIVASSVEAAGWADGLVVVQSAVLGGALVAFLLALTRWGPGFSIFYGFVASIPWIATALVHTFVQTSDMHEGVITLGQHYAKWYAALVGGTASGDNWVFVIQLCIIGWWIAFFAVWTLFRHQRAWQAMLPAGIGILVNAYYAPQDVRGYVVAFLIAALLLAVRVELARNEARWQMAHIRYAPDMYIDFLKNGLVFAVIVVLAAWLLPAVNTNGTKLDDVIQPLHQPWQQLQQDWQRMFSSLKYKNQTYVSTYGKSLSLGGPVSLTDRPVFEATSPMRVYWRGATYDTYTGSQWLNTDQQVMQIDQGKRYAEPIFNMMGAISATIHTLQPGQNVLFGPPSPIGATLPVDADVTPLGGSGADAKVLVSLLRSRTNLRNNSIYTVASAVSMAPPASLRTDNTNYPDWVKQRFLQVPDELPARVKQLAQRVAGNQKTEYDKASAIEAYLRQFPYNTQIAAPPTGTDGVDYFLFDIKQGYCDYYASAMVMMLRSLGVPARFVAGYSPGEYNSQTGAWVVLEANAHAWVEVFFPSYGWVQFEPTASQPVLLRPTQAPQTSVPPVGGSSDPNQDLQDMLEQKRQAHSSATGAADLPSPQADPLGWIKSHALGLGLGTLALATVGGLAVYAWRRNRTLFQIDNGLLLRLFELLTGWAERLRIPWPASMTPLERAKTFGQMLPEASAPVNRLTGLLVAQQYGREQVSAETLQNVAGDWRLLQPVLWKRLAKQYLRWPWRLRRRQAT
jgi:transglutaminase-like putative cysteine protease